MHYLCTLCCDLNHIFVILYSYYITSSRSNFTISVHPPYSNLLRMLFFPHCIVEYVYFHTNNSHCQSYYTATLKSRQDRQEPHQKLHQSFRCNFHWLSTLNTNNSLTTKPDSVPTCTKICVLHFCYGFQNWTHISTPFVTFIAKSKRLMTHALCSTQVYSRK
jgi:hypothetical protein